MNASANYVKYGWMRLSSLGLRAPRPHQVIPNSTVQPRPPVLPAIGLVVMYLSAVRIHNQQFLCDDDNNALCITMDIGHF